MCLMLSFNGIINWWLTKLLLILTIIIITNFFKYFVCFDLLIYCLCWQAFIWKMNLKKADLYLERALSKFKWVSRNADNLFKIVHGDNYVKMPIGKVRISNNSCSTCSQYVDWRRIALQSHKPQSTLVINNFVLQMSFQRSH